MKPTRLESFAQSAINFADYTSLIYQAIAVNWKKPRTLATLISLLALLASASACGSTSHEGTPAPSEPPTPTLSDAVLRSYAHIQGAQVQNVNGQPCVTAQALVDAAPGFTLTKGPRADLSKVVETTASVSTEFRSDYPAVVGIFRAAAGVARDGFSYSETDVQYLDAGETVSEGVLFTPDGASAVEAPFALMFGPGCTPEMLHAYMNSLNLQQMAGGVNHPSPELTNQLSDRLGEVMFRNPFDGPSGLPTPTEEGVQ